MRGEYPIPFSDHAALGLDIFDSSNGSLSYIDIDLRIASGDRLT
jgi:hypothetical protein